MTAPSALPAPNRSGDDARVRLHVTPFAPALLHVYLAPSVLPLATNVSYHAVATFPEKGFGYVELPAMEAQKLKKKFHGATLKGSKVRIEDAKPEKRKVGDDGDDGDEAGDVKKAAKRAKKEKKQQGLLEGVELPPGRKVKRGWTDPQAKSKKDKRDKRDKGDDGLAKQAKKTEKKQKASKYSAEPEVLFKAKLTPVAETALGATDKKRKGKKDKTEDKSRQAVTVHEFEHTTRQPSFLKGSKASSKHTSAEYVDGKGWVDGDGRVFEPETSRARHKKPQENKKHDAGSGGAVEAAAAARKVTSPDIDVPAASKSKLRSKLRGSASKKEKRIEAPLPSSSSDSSSESSSESSVESDAESSAGSSSDSSSSSSSSDSESESEAPAQDTQAAKLAQAITVTPPSPSAAGAKEPHPLETLFKRPQTSSGQADEDEASTSAGLAPINTSFAFFNGAAPATAARDGASAMPPTPYTRQDLERRGLRSAAPTPDTAALGRRFSFPWRGSSASAAPEDTEPDAARGSSQLNSNTRANAMPPTIAEEDEDEDAAQSEDSADGDGDDDEDGGDNEQGVVQGQSSQATGKAKAKDKEKGEESAFAKWFWEHRAENTRLWKKRRRDALRDQARKMVGRRS